MKFLWLSTSHNNKDVVVVWIWSIWKFYDLQTRRGVFLNVKIILIATFDIITPWHHEYSEINCRVFCTIFVISHRTPKSEAHSKKICWLFLLSSSSSLHRKQTIVIWRETIRFIFILRMLIIAQSTLSAITMRNMN